MIPKLALSVTEGKGCQIAYKVQSFELGKEIWTRPLTRINLASGCSLEKFQPQGPTKRQGQG